MFCDDEWDKYCYRCSDFDKVNVRLASGMRLELGPPQSAKRDPILDLTIVVRLHDIATLLHQTRVSV